MSTLFFKRSRRGAGLVEYGILTGLIAVVAIASVTFLGGQVRDIFSTVTNTLSTQITADAGVGTGAAPNPVLATITVTSGNYAGNTGNCSAAYTGCGSNFGSATPVSFDGFTLAGVSFNGARIEMQFGGTDVATLGANLNYAITCGGAGPFSFADQNNLYQSGWSTMLNIPTTETPFTIGGTEDCTITAL